MWVEIQLLNVLCRFSCRFMYQQFLYMCTYFVCCFFSSFHYDWIDMTESSGSLNSTFARMRCAYHSECHETARMRMRMWKRETECERTSKRERQIEREWERGRETETERKSSVALEPNDGASVMNAKHSHHVKLYTCCNTHQSDGFASKQSECSMCIWSAGNVWWSNFIPLAMAPANRATMLCLWVWQISVYQSLSRYACVVTSHSVRYNATLCAPLNYKPYMLTIRT